MPNVIGRDSQSLLRRPGVESGGDSTYWEGVYLRTTCSSKQITNNLRRVATQCELNPNPHSGQPGFPGVPGTPGNWAPPGAPGAPGEPGPNGAPGTSGRPGSPGNPAYSRPAYPGDGGAPGPNVRIIYSIKRRQNSDVFRSNFIAAFDVNVFLISNL